MTSNEALFSNILAKRGGTLETRFPSNINALGSRPAAESKEGGINSRAPFGNLRATGIVASGRFGGSKERSGYRKPEKREIGR